MKKDFKWFTVHVNRCHLTNFALGFDFYNVYDYPSAKYDASVLQFSFLFFNITLTKWADPYVS